ncbi:MAG: hypothetical protein KDD52_00770 [Bdellovibrionales bacterium]|nr:hypothetical protein [Bdellovibrionales bacterium]
MLHIHKILIAIGTIYLSVLSLSYASSGDTQIYVNDLGSVYKIRSHKTNKYQYDIEKTFDPQGILSAYTLDDVALHPNGVKLAMTRSLGVPFYSTSNVYFFSPQNLPLFGLLNKNEPLPYYAVSGEYAIIDGHICHLTKSPTGFRCIPDEAAPQETEGAEIFSFDCDNGTTVSMGDVIQIDESHFLSSEVDSHADSHTVGTMLRLYKISTSKEASCKLVEEYNLREEYRDLLPYNPNFATVGLFFDRAKGSDPNKVIKLVLVDHSGDLFFANVYKDLGIEFDTLKQSQIATLHHLQGATSNIFCPFCKFK